MAITIIFLMLLVILDKSKYYLYLLPFCIGIFLFGYMINNPPIGADLYRYYRSMDYLLEYGPQVFEYYDVNNEMFIAKYFMYLCALLGKYNLVPAISGFVIYFLIIRGSIKVTQQYSISGGSFAITILWWITDYAVIQYVGVYRYLLCTALFFTALCLDIIHKKRNVGVVILYIAPLFIHSTGAVLLIARIFVELYRKKMGDIILIIVATYSLWLTFVVKLLSYFSNIQLIHYLIGKIDQYSFDGFNGLYEALFLKVVECIILFMILIYTRHKGDMAMKKLSSIGLFILSFCFGCWLGGFVIVFERFFLEALIISIPCILYFFSIRRGNIFFKIGLIGIILLNFIQQHVFFFTKGGLYSYTGYDLFTFFAINVVKIILEH